MSTNGINFGKKSQIDFSSFGAGLKRESLKTDTQKSIFNSIDIDKNGVLDKSELEAFQKNLDANGDGSVEKKEVDNYFEKMSNFFNPNGGKVDKKQNQAEMLKFLQEYGANTENILSTEETEANGVKTVTVKYKDNTAEVIKLDSGTGNKEVITTDANGDTTSITTNSDGKKLKEATHKDGKNTEIVYDADGEEVPQTETTTYDNSAKKLVVRYMDGEKFTATETNGQTEESSYLFTEDGENMLLTSKIVNKGLPNEVKTTYQYNSNNEIVSCTEGDNEYICEQNGDGIKKLPTKEVSGKGTPNERVSTYTYDENNTLLTKTIAGKDRTTEITYQNGDENNYSLVEKDKSGNVLITKTVEGGQVTSGVAYDDKNNTVGAFNQNTGKIEYFKVQVGEQSIADLAEKFGVSVDEMYQANKDNPALKGVGANAKFDKVGCNFVIPGRLESQDARIQGGRQSIDEIRTQTNDVNEANRIAAEQQNQAQHDRLMSKYKGYGLINTNGAGSVINVSQRIGTLEDSARTYTPPLKVKVFGEAFDGGKIGQIMGAEGNRIVYINKDGVISDHELTLKAARAYAMYPDRATTATVNGKEVPVVYLGNDPIYGKEIYVDSSGNRHLSVNGSIVSEQSYETEQSKSNGVKTQNKDIANDLYKAMSKNSWAGNDLGSNEFKTAFNKINSDNVLEVLDAYKETNSDGESLMEAIMDEVTSTGNAAKCRQIIDMMYQRAKASGMPDSQLKSLYDKCIAACNNANCTKTADLVTAVNTFAGAITAAEMNKDGAVANTTLTSASTEAAGQANADIDYQIDHQGWVAGAFEYANPFNRLDSDFGTSLGSGRDAARAKINEFSNTMKELEQIRTTKGQTAFEAKFKEKFGVPYSQKAFDNYVNLKNNYETAISCHQLENEYAQFKSTVKSNNVDSKIDEFVSKYCGNNADVKAEINKALEAYERQGMNRKQAFDRFLDQNIRSCKETKEKSLGGKSLYQMGNAVKGSFDGLFGTNTGINEVVAQYVDRQQAGEHYSIMGAKIALAVGTSILTANPLTGAAVVTGGGVVLDVSNDLSAAGDGINGTRLTNDRLNKSLADNLENGALMVIGGSTASAVEDLGLQGIKKYTTLTVMDTANSTTMEVIFKGGDKVTINGIMYKAIFSAAGNITQFVPIDAEVQGAANEAISGLDVFVDASNIT